MYQADAPLNIRSVFYVPTNIPEMFGFGRMESGVSLYSRKILIQSKSPKLLPDWLRFMRGVVDSEDIPLNLSRELLQDSTLLHKLSEVLIAKLLRFFIEQSKKDSEKFNKFMKECSNFFREGVVTTQSSSQREEISKLLRFESSKGRSGELKTLTDYVSDMREDQKEIFYLCAPRYFYLFSIFVLQGTSIFFLFLCSKVLLSFFYFCAPRYFYLFSIFVLQGTSIFFLFLCSKVLLSFFYFCAPRYFYLFSIFVLQGSTFLF